MPRPEIVAEGDYTYIVVEGETMLSRYTGKTVCRACGGSRLRKEALYVRVGGKNISEVMDMQIKDLQKWSEQMASMGREKQKRWLIFFLRMTRENFMYNFHHEELNYMTQKEEDFARNFARFVNENNILPINDVANLAIRDIGQNANAKIVFFDFALQMIVLLLQK